MEEIPDESCCLRRKARGKGRRGIFGRVLHRPARIQQRRVDGIGRSLRPALLNSLSSTSPSGRFVLICQVTPSILIPLSVDWTSSCRCVTAYRIVVIAQIVGLAERDCHSVYRLRLFCLTRSVSFVRR